MLNNIITNYWDTTTDQWHIYATAPTIMLEVGNLSFQELQQLLETTPSVALTGWIEKTFSFNLESLSTIVEATQLVNQSRGWIHNPTCPGGIMKLHEKDFLYLKSYGDVEYWIEWEYTHNNPNNLLAGGSYSFTVAINYNRDSEELFGLHQSIINS